MKTITAYQCVNCQHIMYPHHYSCLNCNGREFDEIHPSGNAKLLTYTIVNELPWGIDERGRVLGVVEFENGVKALGLIEADRPKIGMKLYPDWKVVRVIGGVETFGLTLSSKK